MEKLKKIASYGFSVDEVYGFMEKLKKIQHNDYPDFIKFHALLIVAVDILNEELSVDQIHISNHNTNSKSSDLQ